MWSFIPLWSQFFPLKSILIICIIFWAFLLCTMYTMYKTFESWGNFDRKDKNLLLQWQFVVRREFKKVWSLFKLWLQIGFQTKCSYGRLLEYGRNLFLQNLSLWSLIRIWSFIRYSRVRTTTVVAFCIQMIHKAKFVGSKLLNEKYTKSTKLIPKSWRKELLKSRYQYLRSWPL